MIEAKKLKERYESLRRTRDGYWLDHWREVRRYVMPTFRDDLTEGGRRGQELFDTTAIRARQRLAAGIYNWMAPPDKRWFELAPEDDELGKDDEIRSYFAEVTRRIARAMANSNWPGVLIQTLNDLAAGLDGIIYAEEGTDSLLTFRNYPVETVCYSENVQGTVDTLYTEMKMTARQLMEKFDEGRLPEKVRQAAASAEEREERFRILHAIFPRHDRVAGMIDNINYPVADVYMELESGAIIYEGGYLETPFAVCRFSRAPHEMYGRGPGSDLLSDIKMLNRMVQTFILNREHQADPSWLIPDGSLTSRNLDRDPGGVVFYRPDMGGAKPELMTRPNPTAADYQDIAEMRKDIREGFFNDIFDPLGDLKQITATEAEIRNEGKLIPFAPIAGNLHNELFRVLIHRVYGILSRAGELPEAPEALADAEYKIEFVSKIALSIKKVESIGWLETEAALANIVQLQPEIMDNFLLDDVAREISHVNGANPKWLRSIRDREKLRAERAEAQARQEAAAQLAEAARSAGNLGKAPEEGSPLAAVMNGNGV